MVCSVSPLIPLSSALIEYDCSNYTSVTNPPLPEFQEVDDAQWQEEEEVESESAKLKRIRKRSSVSTHDGKLEPPTANAFALINMSGAFSLSKFVTTHHAPVSKNEELSTSVEIKDTPLKAGNESCCASVKLSLIIA